jgi:hypothetical protein
MVETRFEPKDAPLRVVGLLAGIVAGVIGLVIASLLLIYPHSTNDQPKAPKAATEEPRLQPDPRGDMDKARAEAMRELHGYGWIDRDKGIVHLPIEEAERRVVERGIPDWPEVKR